MGKTIYKTKIMNLLYHRKQHDNQTFRQHVTVVSIMWTHEFNGKNSDYLVSFNEVNMKYMIYVCVVDTFVGWIKKTIDDIVGCYRVIRWFYLTDWILKHVGWKEYIIGRRRDYLLW